MGRYQTTVGVSGVCPPVSHIQQRLQWTSP